MPTMATWETTRETTGSARLADEQAVGYQHTYFHKGIEDGAQMTETNADAEGEALLCRDKLLQTLASLNRSMIRGEFKSAVAKVTFGRKD